MTDTFAKLFEPGRIGRMQLKNRFIQTAMHVGLEEDDGSMSQLYRDFLVTRARGGAALITVGGAYPHVSGKGFFKQMGADRDEFVPGWKSVVDEVHSAGARAMLQFMHVGRYSFPEILGAQPVAPSALAPRIPRGTPRELATQEVRDLVQAHAAAAARAKAAGFDAVELSASTGYLIASFLSPYSNHRTDEYGGDLAGRARFLVEIIRAMKEKNGADFPVLARMNADDLLPGEGNTVEDNIRLTQMAAEAGADAISLTVGWHESRIPAVTMDVAIGNWIELSKRFRQALKVPVIMAYQLTTPEAAAQAIGVGAVDYVGMARPLIADPELPKKVQEGRVDDINPCILCNTCFEKIFGHEPVRCTVNTEAAQEAAFALRPAARPKRVLVVGGGPAGLEAARVAALRGHKVTLYEQTGALGGQLLLASIPPFRQRLAEAYLHLARQAKKAGASIVMNQSVTPALIEKEQPEAVILAAGALPAMPPIFRDEKRAVLAWDVLRQKTQTGKNVVVIGGGLVGVGVAEWLVAQGKVVTIVEMLKRIAADAPPFDRLGLMQRLAEHKVRMLTSTVAERMEDGTLIVSKEGGEQEQIPAESVVIAVGARPNQTLLPAIQARVPEVYTVGDCVEPRRAYQAIHDGSRVAREI
ncbi:MAG TPA: FAD-dependent oxidoreductase [Dehalococcoidia bacterium]|nr:FAD-dependent oxidoreductase [Dehalococcoidia bacterium]